MLSKLELHHIADVAKKRIVRIGNVAERGLMVEDPYGKYPEPVSESCVMSTAQHRR